MPKVEVLPRRINISPDLKSPLSTAIPIHYAERLRRAAKLMETTSAALARQFIMEGLDRFAKEGPK